MARWENDTRWYEAMVCVDLFGAWTVVRTWGGKHSCRQGHRVDLVDGLVEGAARIEALHSERIRRKPPYKRTA